MKNIQLDVILKILLQRPTQRKSSIFEWSTFYSSLSSAYGRDAEFFIHTIMDEPPCTSPFTTALFRPKIAASRGFSRYTLWLGQSSRLRAFFEEFTALLLRCPFVKSYATTRTAALLILSSKLGSPALRLLSFFGDFSAGSLVQILVDPIF